MSLYAFKTDHSTPVTKWVNATRKRGKSNNVLKNPFIWTIKTFKRKDDLIVVVDAKPLLPNFSWMGWMGGVMILFVWGASTWLIPFLVLGCLGVFWTAEFLFLMTRKALRKHGYSGPIKRLKLTEFIREVIL